MKRFLLLGLATMAFQELAAQSYTDSILQHRTHYKNEFITDAHSPLKVEDTGYLRFFAPDASYRVIARLKLTPESAPFQIPTRSGKTKTYRKYGELSFKLLQKTCTLEVYQSPDLMKQEALKNHLFVPFNDLTNYEQTYAGGRYIDLSTTDIVDNTIVLDFNKCYNPYCAYASGYNCPIPPDANRLKVAIRAGEQLFGRRVEE